MKRTMREQTANSFGAVPWRSLFGLVFGVFAAASSQAQEAAFSAAEMRQTVNTYCLACHNDFLLEADLSLQSVDFSRPGEYADELERMVRKLRAHMMPPEGMPRPPFEMYEVMTSWLESELDAAWAARPNPGRVTPLHRMNRYEYNNTINELLGIDVDVMELLPGDPTADGSFDNIAASLPFTTSHMERYMSVARQVTRLAVGLPPAGPTATTYEIPLYMSQEWRQNDDMPFGSRGGVSAEHYFPVDGVYRISAQLETNYQDYIKGLGWEQMLEIRLDGRLLERFSVGGDAPGIPAPLSFTGTGESGSVDWEQYMLYGAGEGLEVIAPVTAGPHVVTASYVRQQVDREGVPQPNQGGRLLANDEVYLDYQKVHAIEIGGPHGGLAANADSPSRAHIFSCYPDSRIEEAACASEILTSMARRAYRRPATGEDTELLLGFFNEGREQGGSFDTGIQFALEYLLSDPEFLVRSYEAPSQTGGVRELSALELASRLSYFLWSSAPDEELLRLAEDGRLSDPNVYAGQARRLLADRRGVETLVEDFAAQWLNLRRLDEVVINTVIFPEYDVSLIEAFERETGMFIADALREDASILDLIGADYTFVNERLARHYGIGGVYGSRFRKAEIPDTGKRGGLLGNGALLTVTSYPGRTSPVLRGKWLLDNMLGTPPPAPPPNVPVLAEAGGVAPESIRERLAQHREDPVCSSCHVVIDPLGFALENFDVIGAWRDFDEAGNPVDPNGNYPGGVEFGGFADLRDWMLDRPDQFAHTVTEKLMTYALGRRVEYYDQPVIRRIVREAAGQDYRWSAIVLGIVQSEPFRMTVGANVQSEPFRVTVGANVQSEPFRVTVGARHASPALTN